MSLLRRLTAVLSSVLLLQLMLLGSGAFCTMAGGASHGMGAGAMASMAGMAGMAGSTAGAGLRHAASAAGRHATTVSTATDEQDSGHDCHQPWVPAGCDSMASCVIAVAALPSRALVAVSIPASVAEIREPAAARAGPTFAPELPPPRA